MDLTGLLLETVAESTGYPAENFHTRNIVDFAADVRQRTGGALRIEVRPDGSFVAADSIREAVREGRATAGEFLLASAGRDQPLLQVDAVPFLATSYHDARVLWKASRKYVSERLAQQGMTPVAVIPQLV